MDKNHQIVAPLKKLSLALSIGNSLASINITQPMSFIFGIGVNGLTHFEYMLAGKQIGNEVIFQFNKNDAPHQFGHLHKFLPVTLPDDGPVDLKIVITDISEPAQREIIKAMAEVAACGSDCGCGCGSHEAVNP
jgi:hypothetical protein